MSVVSVQGNHKLVVGFGNHKLVVGFGKRLQNGVQGNHKNVDLKLVSQW